MENVTSLIIKYKENKSSKILDVIFKKLHLMLEKKIKFIYYKQYFPLSLYHKCSHCRNCEVKDCRECNICTCIKGTFNLYEQNLCELDDVRHDLIIETMRMIENFDITKDFNTYFIATLWNFKPSFLTRDMVNTMVNKSLYSKNENGKEDDYIDKSHDKVSEFDINSLLESLSNETERKIVHMLLHDNKIEKKIIAEKLGLSVRRVNQLMSKIKNKISYLTK